MYLESCISQMNPANMSITMKDAETTIYEANKFYGKQITASPHHCLLSGARDICSQTPNVFKVDWKNCRLSRSDAPFSVGINLQPVQ